MFQNCGAVVLKACEFHPRHTAQLESWAILLKVLHLMQIARLGFTKCLLLNMAIVPCTEIVRIYDGNSSLKRRQYRTVAVPKQAPALVLLVSLILFYHFISLQLGRIAAENSATGKLLYCLTSYRYIHKAAGLIILITKINEACKLFIVQENISFITSSNLNIEIVKVCISEHKLLYEILWTDMQLGRQEDRQNI